MWLTTVLVILKPLKFFLNYHFFLPKMFIIVMPKTMIESKKQ